MPLTNKKIPFCVIPFTKGFAVSDGSFVNCCATDPNIQSNPTDSFADWWSSNNLNNFRTTMENSRFPPECALCEVQEKTHGTSFRLAANKEVTELTSTSALPSSWHLIIGNKCNLACWICNETYSSTIAQHKQKINILPSSYVDPNVQFLKKWPALKQNILDSYTLHDVITITLLGGEPVYNKLVVNFLQELNDLGLASRTRLEFTTNGTVIGKQLSNLFKNVKWNYICVFISVDAVGTKAEWVRYGSKWADVDKNIKFYSDTVDYVEIHTTLSMLNLNTLPELVQYVSDNKLQQNIFLLSDPTFMDIRKWNGSADFIDTTKFNNLNIAEYLKFVGTTPSPTASADLATYINQFSAIRTPLSAVDPTLALALGVL